MKKETEASLHAFSEHGVLEEKDWDMILICWEVVHMERLTTE